MDMGAEMKRVPWHDPPHPEEVETLEGLIGVSLDKRTKECLAALGAEAGNTGSSKFHIAKGGYIFGSIAIPAVIREKDLVVYHEVDVLISESSFVTVRREHPADGLRFNPDILLESCPEREGTSSGEMFYRLMEDVVQAYQDLLRGLQDEIDELEQAVSLASDNRIHQRYSALRRDLVAARRNIAPLLRALRAIEDKRLDVHDRIFPADTEILVRDVREDLDRVEEAIPLIADLLSGVRDYHQSFVSQRQNDIVQNLTVVASLLLVPTLIVGIYGQNFDRLPETHWAWGYGWSWILILGTTVIQLLLFWRLGWFTRRKSTPDEGEDLGSVLESKSHRP